jgi:AraC-like DNA-binding protein
LLYWAALGPVSYLYIDSLIIKDRKFRLTDLIFALPVLLIAIPYLDYLASNYHDTDFFGFVIMSNVLYYVILVLWDIGPHIFFIFALIKLIRHKRNVRKYFSSIQRIDLKWALYIISGFLVYLFVSYIIYYLDIFSVIDLALPSIEIITVVLVLYVFGLGLFGYRQNGVFYEEGLREVKHFNIPPDAREEHYNQEKYLKSGLAPDETEQIISELELKMKKEKVYLDFDLNINNLADMLGTSMHKLSQVINTKYGKNFYDFINSYRVDEFKKRIRFPENKNLKIMAIAYDSGFNSKSAFYASFKKATGTTPTVYRKKIMEEEMRILVN